MENEWYIDALKEGIRQAESGCKDCKYEYRKNLSNSAEPCNDCDIAHGWTPKDEEPKKSGRYPWEEPRNTHTYSGWINKVIDECHEMHIQVGDYYEYIGMMLQANIADELHRLNDILSRRKG